MKYTKKPVEIEAIQWNGDNMYELMEFSESSDFVFGGTEELPTLCIETLEGNHYALIGDYIIKGVKGEFYPCKPDIFKLTYDKSL